MKSDLPPLHIEPFISSREWNVDDITILTATISLPQPVPATTSISRRIRRFYLLQARSYLRYCERWLLPKAKEAYRNALASSTPLPCFHAELTYQITYHQGGLWSLYTQSQETTLSDRPFLARHGDTWDLATGFPLPMQAFFPPHSRWKKRIIDCISHQIELQERSGNAVYYPNWRKDLRQHFNSRNYFLTEGGLSVFFPMYAIAPSVERIPTFLIPFCDDESSSFLHLA